MNTKHQEKFSELIVSEVEEAAIRRRADRVGKQVGEAVSSFLAEIMISILASRPQEVIPVVQAASARSHVAFLRQKQTPYPKPDGILTAGEVAQVLRLSKAKAYRLMQQGEIRSIKFDRTTRVRRQDLDEFINTHMK